MEEDTFPDALKKAQVTILGYGSLMSESSAKLTFPHLTNFRYVKVTSMKRLFIHPHLFLLSEGLIDPNETLKLASLSVEQTDDMNDSFIAVAFDVTLDDNQRRDFVQREKAYNIISTPYFPIPINLVVDSKTTFTSGANDDNDDDNDDDIDDDNDDDVFPTPEGEGVICVASKDTELPNSVKIHDSLKDRGGIWHWPKDSGLLPASIYLRHCLLSLEKVGGIAYDSFLHDTYLADRKTSLMSYLEDHREEVMSSKPPSHLSTRFGG